MIPALVLGAALPSIRAQVLVWSMGDSQAGAQSVADALTATGDFSSVTAFNGTTLTLTDLQNYQEVLFYSNSSNGSDPSVGDALADFADTGKRLVLATFSWADQGGNTLGGRIISDQISPFVFTAVSAYSNVTIASTDGGPFFTGVNSIQGYYHDNVQAVSGATVLGTWSDGNPLLAVKGNVVAVNLFPDSPVPGDYVQLFANSLLAPVPEPDTSSLLLAGTAVLGVARVIRRKQSMRR
jgi:hypothetical protein